MARGQTDYEYIYWFDGDDSSIKTIEASGNQLHLDTDVSHLNGELHTLTMQVRDEEGVLSPPETRMFMLFNDVSVLQGYYWFDNEDNSSVELYGRGSFDVDVSALEDGLHTIHYMTVDVNGNHSSPKTRWFAKIPQTANEGTVLCRCVIDGEPYHIEEVSAMGGIINWSFDVSKLSQGVHSIQVQVEMPDGKATAIQHGMFVRTATSEELSSMKCYYLIDNSESYVEAGMYDGSLYHVDLDVSSLDNGLHQISYMLVGNNGVASKMCSALFTKIPVGGNGITKYEYWLNDNEAEKTVVVFEEHIKSYQLVKLLPVESVPIRSSCFHFEVDEEKGPMLYAKNEFHVRFFDVTGRLVDATKEYLDYNVSEKITGAEEIKKSQTFARPVENGIKWFTLQACEGDTIAFRSSQALSLQVFSPSGMEIYTASGAESVKWDGCHTWEEGTHYVAVHDVTGSQPNVTLDYLHMDKYDVVDQDVRVVGNGGCSTITFYGNGFNYLKSVCLINSLNDTIRSFSKKHISDAVVSCIFDFTDCATVSYDALFEFVDESKLFKENIIVEETSEMSLTTFVEYSPQYLRGTSTTYTIQIHNNGNMTAYSVPIYMYISTPSIEGISHIDIEGLDLPGVFSEVDMTSFSDSDKEMLKTLEKKIGDSHYFIKSKTTNESTGDSIITRVGYFFVNINPHSSQSISLDITANEAVDVWVTIPELWHSGRIEDASYANSMRMKGKMNPYCCYRDKIECVANILVDGLDLVSAITGCIKCPASVAISIVDCAASALNTLISSIGTVLCDENDFKEDFAQAAWNVVQRVGMSLPGTIMGCASTILGLKGTDDAAQLLSALVVSWDFTVIAKPIIDCSKAFTQKIPGCPPVPPKGGTSSPVNSYDPNAIYGYVSPSGSMYIAKDSVETVNYRIEFENDTAFATSSAHIVEIRDTLDSHYFELSTFAPTYLNIGDKRVQLDGTPNFVRTVDMRPQINTVVQVEGEYDEQAGIARWLFTSLDPMTMEPTDDVMQGFLPVNHDGTSGIGDVGYRIGVKKGLVDGTEISNRASIVFDSNEPILTPTWTNIVDGVCPESRVTDVTYKNDSIVTLSIEGSDERSGIWRYDLYVQYGVGAPWIKEAELAADSTEVDFRIYDGLYYGFCALATDSAGNVEQKLLQPEALCAEIHFGDVNSDGVVNERDAQLTMDYYLEKPVAILAAAADVNEDGVVNTLDVTLIVQMYMNAENAKESAPVIKQYYTIRR